MSGPYGMDALFSDWGRAVRASPMVIRNELGAMMDKAFVRLLAEPRFVDGRRRPGSIDRLRAPRRHPTKGFRGAHKLFRGGSR